MNDAEIQEMIRQGRHYQFHRLTTDLFRCFFDGQTWPLRWIGPGLVDRAWEAIDP